MSEEAKPAEKTIKLLAEQEIKNSMADAKFYEQMPEFLPIRMKMKAMHDDLITPRGCSSCAKNRVFRNLGGEYLTIVSTLRPDSAERFKKYFGADELRVNVVDPVTRTPKTIKL